MKVNNLKTRKLTEAAMLSALFVVVSIVAISTGIIYSLYLDMIVPIFISILYLRIEAKYTVLSAITSLLIVALTIGDVPSAIWMSQGIILGLICGFFISKKGDILDDILWASIGGCFIVILIDVYLTTLTGYSLIKDFDSVAVMFPLSEELTKMAFYIFVATIPVGTVLVSYIGTLFIGHKLNILNEASKEKYKIVRNFRKIGGYLCCSKKTYLISIGYLFIVEIINSTNFIINSTYINTVIMSIRVVFMYFVIKDSFGFIRQYIYIKSKSQTIAQILSFSVLYLLIVNIYLTTIVLIIGSVVVNLLLPIRDKEINTIKKYLEVDGQK